MVERWSWVGVIPVVLFVVVGLCEMGVAEERYTVKPGDTLYGISKSYGVSVDRLKEANHLQKDAIKARQILVIPAPRGMRREEPEEAPQGERVSYLVKKGDTLSSISRRAGLSVQDVKTLNKLQSESLQPGQKLLLPRTRPEMEEMEEDGDREDIISPSVAEKGKEAVEEPLSKWSSSEERTLFVKVVKNFLGVPYRLGGSTLRGIDCSAFVKKIYEIFNVSLPRTTREQFRMGKSVPKEDLEEGDLVFFNTNTRRANTTHVGIYIGNKEFVHASSQNQEVKVDNLDMPYFNKRFLRGVRIKEVEKDS